MRERILPPIRKSAEKSRDAKTNDRREAIIAGLRHCMLRKGYAETNLTELARESGLSVSHLLYYFPGKEAVLEALCDRVVDRVYTDVTAHRTKSPEERLHILVDNIFIQGAVARSELGIVRELNALAAHRPAIRRKLKRYTDRIMAYLEELFGQLPGQPDQPAADAAEIAGALWMGLLTNIHYDKRLNDKRARVLFSKTLFALAGLPDPGTRAPRRKTKRLDSAPVR